MTAARPRPTCPSCVIRHQGLCAGVSDHDIDGSSALEASHSPTRVYDAGDLVYVQGDANDYVFNLISGWVALHQDLPDGRRQIIQILQRGALFGLDQAGQSIGHGATAITNAAICPIRRSKLDVLRRENPALNERFIWLLQADSHRAFETLAILGQGSAKERVGGLLAELVATSAGDSEIDEGTFFKIPLTQRHIAEATGLTAIHVNRVLRQLREEHTVDVHNGLLAVLDPPKLGAFRGHWRGRSRSESAGAPRLGGQRAIPPVTPSSAIAVPALARGES